MSFATLEIRNYRFKPHTLEHFIDYFEHHFIESQEAVGMYPLGQFRVAGDPNRFVWLRGFADMGSRHASLNAFYSGAVWEKYKPFANHNMLEWHDVHLLRPVSDIAALTGGDTSQSIAAALADGTVSPDADVFAVDYFTATPDRYVSILDSYRQSDVQIRGAFAAEMGENTFTRLPVIQNADEFAVVSAYPDESAARRQRAHLPAATESLLLMPTLRSPMRYKKLTEAEN